MCEWSVADKWTSRAKVKCSGDPKWRRAVQAFTSSVHVFWLARARNNGLGDGSECVCRLGIGGDVAGIWRGECQRESSPLVDGAHGSAGLSQRSLLCLTDYYQPPASSSLPTHYSSNSQTLSRFFNLVQARHSICPTSPSPPQQSLPLRRRLLARTHQSPYTVHQAPTPGLPQTA